MSEVSESVSETVNLSEASDADVRRNFSAAHLSAANYFATELEKHEIKHLGAGWANHFDFCRWHATASIIMSFSGIEAAIDEAADDKGTPDNIIKELVRKPTLDYAQEILLYHGKLRIDEGREPFQSVELLRTIRNALVHPKAEWDSSSSINSKLSKKILGAKLPLSPFQSDPNLVFPIGCMSAGVAKWSVQSARQFIQVFRSTLGVPISA